MTITKFKPNKARRGGRPEKLSPEEKQLLFANYDIPGTNIQDLCEAFGISEPTLRKYLRNRREEDQAA